MVYIEKIWMTGLAVSLMLIFACYSYGNDGKLQHAKAECFSTHWPHEKSDLKPDPALTFGKLDNGFRYVLMENNEPRDRVAIYLDIQAGSLHESDEERGFAHFLEHMLFNGSTHFKPGDLIAYFQSIGMDFGGDTNAHTTFNETVYNILLPKGDIEEIGKGFLVMKDYSRGALLLPSEVERERGVILAEKMARDSASYRTRLATRKNSLRGSILADREPIGIDQTLKLADAESLRSFYNHWYRPEKMILVVVGDFDKKAVEPLLQKTFSSLNGVGDKPPCPDFGKIVHRGIEAFYHNEPDDGGVSVSIESHWNKERQNDSYGLQVNLLKEYFANRILQKRLNVLEEQDGAVFSRSHAYSGSLLDRIGYTGISVSTNDQNWQSSLEILEQSLRRFLIYGVTDEEIEVVKKEIVSYFNSSVLTFKTRKSSSLARQIVRSINGNRVFQSPQQEMDLYLSEVEKFNAIGINKVMQNLWAHDSRLIEITGNVAINNGNPEKIIKNVFLESEKVSVSKPDSLKKLNFPYLEVADTVIEPTSASYIQEINAEIFEYDNGVVLNLKKTDFSINELEVTINFGLGKQSEPLPGLGMLAESVVGASGSGRYTESEMERVLADSSVEYDFEIKSLNFAIQGSATSNEAELLVQTLHTLMFDPAIRKEVFLNKMRRYKQMYLKLQSDIQGGDPLYVNRFLAGGNVLFGIPSWEVFSKLQLSDISDWLLPYFNNSPLEISVVGDFDKKKVIELVGKYFGSQVKKERVSISHNPIKFPKGETLNVEIPSKIDKAMVTVAWETDEFVDISKTRRLHMLAAILDERIRLAVREKLGASYSPNVHNSPSRFIPGYGVMSAKMIVDPQKIKIVKNTVFEICNDLIKNGVEQDELERVKLPLLTSLKDRVRSNRYWLYSVLSLSSIYQDQLVWPTTILEDNSSVTAVEMTEYARKYLKPEEAAIAVVKPRE